jgi:hypothetical protein
MKVVMDYDLTALETAVDTWKTAGTYTLTNKADGSLEKTSTARVESA